MLQVTKQQAYEKKTHKLLILSTLSAALSHEGSRRYSFFNVKKIGHVRHRAIRYEQSCTAAKGLRQCTFFYKVELLK